MLANVWDYFEGGLEGVKSRFCQEVANSFKKVSEPEIESLEEYIGLSKGALHKIIQGEDIKEDFTSRLMEDLCISGRIDMVDLFQLRDLSQQEKDDVLAQMRTEKFVCFLGAGDVDHLKTI